MVESITFLNPWLTSHGLSKTLPSLFMHFPYFYLPIYNHLDMCEMYHFIYMSSFKMYIKLYAHIFNLYKFNLLSILDFFFTSFIQHHFFQNYAYCCGYIKFIAFNSQAVLKMHSPHVLIWSFTDHQPDLSLTSCYHK